ncbi:MAG: hypothetical protein ACK5RC_07980 [Curvibacter sp.]
MLNPEDGKLYKLRLKLEDDGKTLEVRGIHRHVLPQPEMAARRLTVNVCCGRCAVCHRLGGEFKHAGYHLP